MAWPCRVPRGRSGARRDGGPRRARTTRSCPGRSMGAPTAPRGSLEWYFVRSPSARATVAASAAPACSPRGGNAGARRSLSAAMDVDVGSSAPAASEAAAGDAADLELRRFTTDFLSHCCSAIPLCGMTLSMGNNWRRNRSGVRASCSRKFASKVIHELQLIKGRRMVKPPTAALDGWQFMLNRHADDRKILVKEKGHDKQWNGQRISEAMCGLYLKRLLPVDHLLAHQRTLSASHQSLTARQDHTLTQAPPAWPDPMSHSPAVWRPSTVGAAAPWRQWLRGS